MLNKSEKLTLNKFILKLGISYDSNKQVYVNATGVELKAPEKYIFGSFEKTFGRKITSQEQAYITRWCMLKYDFDNVPYKDYLDELVDIQNPKIIDDLRANYNNYLESIQNRIARKQCIYICGMAGAGKTTYAKLLASKYYSQNEIFISSSGAHPFDEYYGQKCIILDDFRDSDMRYNELLKLLDNNTSSNVGARYHNKSLARCETIFLTSVMAPTQLYQGIEEERFQLYRRIKYFKIAEDKLHYYEIDKQTKAFKLANSKDITFELAEFTKEHEKEETVKIEDIFQKEEVKECNVRKVEIDDDDLPF